MRFEQECKWCRGNGKVADRKTLCLVTCPTCKGDGKIFRKISYAGPVGQRMLAAERRELAYIRQDNKAGKLGGTLDFKAQERLRQKGRIIHVDSVRNLVGGWMVVGWRKPVERSYYGAYGTKLWSPVTKKLVKSR